MIWTNKQPGIESLLDSPLAVHSLPGKPSIKRETIGDLSVWTRFRIGCDVGHFAI